MRGGGGGSDRFTIRTTPPLFTPVLPQLLISPPATDIRRYQDSFDGNKTHMLTILLPLLDESGLGAEEEFRRLLEAGHSLRSQKDSGIVVCSRKGMT